MEYQSHKPINTVKIYRSSMGVCYIDSHFSDFKWWNRAIQRSSWFKCNRKRPCEIVRWYHSNRICIYSVCDAITYSLLVLILSTSIEFLIFGSFVPYSVFATSFRSGSRGRVQGMRPPPPLRDGLRFSNTTVFWKKKLCGLLVLK